MELLTSWERMGMEKGLEQGIKQGLKQGLQEGIKQGQKEARLEIAQRLIEMNMSREDIIKATGLSEEEVDELIQQHLNRDRQ